ncbi:MAG: iron ABC transporter permease [Anaerolineae bacterium]|nr:iron ABC transporter permease [Anaerolineae bacterium]
MHKLPSLKRAGLVYPILGLALIMGLVVSLGVGAVPLTPGEVLAALSGSPLKASHQAIVWDFRLARVLLAGLCGAALASAGAGFQGLFRNPLADPFVVGASGGAALGATLAIVLGSRGPIIPVGIAGFIGALCAVLLVYSLSEISGYGSVASLLLVGASLSTMFSALVSLLMMLKSDSLHEVFAWLLGGFSGRSWPQLGQALLAAPIGMIVMWLMARPLDALAAGEESAQALGLNLRRSRLVIIAGASLATAAAVAAGGIIGFVGLIAPHLARPLVGASHARLIPASALIGSLLLLFADGLARTLAPPLELPVGIFTALLGGPFFLVLLWKGGRSR